MINIKILMSLVSAIFKVAITFGLIFNISFTAAPSISTGRIALLIMFILYGRSAFYLLARFALSNKLFITLTSLLLPFTVFWLGINGTEDSVMFSRVFWFLIFTVLGAFLYVRMSRFDLNTAMLFYLLATMLQVMFVFYSVLSPEFRDWVDVALVNSGNIDFSEGVRFSGFSNGGGAILSLQLCLGVVASLVLFTQMKSGGGKFGLVLAALLITIATLFVGRTGLYVSLSLMFGFIFFSTRSQLIPIFLIISLFGGYLYLQSMDLDGVEIEGNDVKLARTFNWALDVFLIGESSSANNLIAKLSNTREMGVTNLLIGSGRVSELGPEVKNYSGHDSGYLQALYALGLPLSILFYGALLGVYVRMLIPLHGDLKVIGIMLVFLIFSLEIKEPFIFKYTLPFFILVYLYIARIQCLNRVNKKYLS